jgi:hypothetical protein
MNQRCVNACFIHLAQRIIIRIGTYLPVVWIGRERVLPNVDLGINN